MTYDNIDSWLLKHGIMDGFSSFLSLNIWEDASKKSMFQKAMAYVEAGFSEQKEPFITLFLICILFGIISQVAIAFERTQLKEFGFFIHFVCCAQICLQLFYESYDMVYQVLNTLVSFYKVLVPTFCLSILCSNGPIKASASHGVIMMVIFVLQSILYVILLPVIKSIMAIQFANAATGQKLLSKATTLAEDGIDFALKGILGIVTGFEVVKSMLVPKATVTTGIRDVIAAIPGIGNLSSNALNLMQGASETMKNSIGAGGIIIITILVLPPVVSLGIYIITFRVLEIVVQPMVQSKIPSLFLGCSSCIRLLFKVLLTAYGLLVISLCVMAVLD